MRNNQPPDYNSVRRASTGHYLLLVFMSQLMCVEREKKPLQDERLYALYHYTESRQN